jgi:hypothetical protein
MQRIIWQYWETKDEKPAFIDGLHELTRRNSGCEVVLVTPQTLGKFLPSVPDDLFRIEVLAHKADMIRAMLLARYGGMWLDSDAIVLHDIDNLFDLLDDYDFVGFNDNGLLQKQRPWVRVNCLLSRPQGRVAREWVRQQHAKFPKAAYGWEEIGTELLHPICLANRASVKVLPFDKICPIPWDRVDEFVANGDEKSLLEACYVVMLSNSVIAGRVPGLGRLSCQDIAEGDYLLSAIMRAALSGRPVDSRKENSTAAPQVVPSVVMPENHPRFLRRLANGVVRSLTRQI